MPVTDLEYTTLANATDGFAAGSVKFITNLVH